MTSSELDESVAERIDELSEQGNRLLEDEGDWRGAINVWQAAAEMLPEPHEQWDEAVWLYASIGTAQLEGGDPNAALSSFEMAYKSGDGRANPYVLLNLGSIMRAHDQDESVQLLLRAFMLEGRDLFEDGHENDLKFLESRVDLNKRPN